MREQTVAIAALAVFLSCPALAQQSSVAVTGFITDTLCGAAGATTNHVEHAKRSVASGKAKYAIYYERTKQLYILEPQETAVQYLGQRVSITGTLTPAPEKRAGQKYDTAEQQVVRHTPRAGVPLDTSTPVAGVLTISSIEPAASEATMSWCVEGLPDGTAVIFPLHPRAVHNIVDVAIAEALKRGEHYTK